MSDRDARIRQAVRESIDLVAEWPWPATKEQRHLFVTTIAGNVSAALDRTDLPPDFPSLEA